MLLSNLDLLATAPGGVARLRELILTLAVQGKLVPQDPKDEPAREVLKKIRAEKDRLIAEGKIKRDKPLAEIAEQEKPFDLPQGWEWVKGRDLFTVVRGVTYQKADAKEAPADHHLPILRANNIRGSVNLDDLVYVPESLVSADQLLRVGDYVVCLASGSKNLVGKAAPFRESLACSFGAFCGAIRPIQELAYFAVYLASPMYRDSVSEASAGIGINNLKGSSLLDLDIALPPEAEQSRIVTCVEELMHLCDALEAKGQLEAAQHAQLVSTLLSTLTASTTPHELAESWQRVATHFDLLLDRPEAVDALEQTILQLAVRGLLVPQDPQDEPASELLKKIRAEKDQLIAQGKIKRDKPLPPIADDEQPFALPIGWEWVRLGDLLEITSSKRIHANDYVKDGVPFFRSKEIGELNRGVEISTEICIKRSQYDSLKDMSGFPQENDLMLTSVGSIGNTWLVDKREFYYKDGNITKLRGYCGTSMQYLQEFIRSDLFVSQVTDTVAGTAYNALTIVKLNFMQFPLPPLAEQSRIVTRVTQLRRLCADLRQRLTTAQSTQSHLAQALVEQVA